MWLEETTQMLPRVMAVASGGGTFLETPVDELARGNALSEGETSRSSKPVILGVAPANRSRDLLH